MLHISYGLLVIVECYDLSMHLLRQIRRYCKLKGKVKYLSFNSLDCGINIIGFTHLYLEMYYNSV